MAENEQINTEVTAEVPATENTSASKGKRNNFSGKRKDDRAQKGDRNARHEQSEFDKRVVSVRRVTKVVKGGRTLRFQRWSLLATARAELDLALAKARKSARLLKRQQQSQRKT